MKEEIMCGKIVHTDFFLFFLQQRIKYHLNHKYVFAFVCKIHKKLVWDVVKSGEQFHIKANGHNSQGAQSREATVLQKQKENYV